MPDKITIYGRDGYLDHIGHLLRVYRKERGTFTTDTGSIVPKTTNSDVWQIAEWYDAELQRMRQRRSHHHPIHDIWREAYARIQRDVNGADGAAEYHDNHWFWFQVLMKLAMHMEGERTTPTRMELILESVRDVAVDDGPDYRNAREPHRSALMPPWRPHGLPRGRGMPDRVIVRHPQPVPTRPVSGPMHAGDHIAIPKSAIAGLIPALGQVWASFLGLPGAPRAIGDDIADRNNAAMHRQALATHAQNQTRILALTNLASRTLRLIL